MSDEVVSSPEVSGRKVRPEILAVAPEIVGMILAKPWRRLAAMLIDLILIVLLSLLSGSFLGIAVGLLLVLLLGNSKPAPFSLRIARWVCRTIGLGVTVISLLTLGHSSFTRLDQLNLGALVERGEIPAMQKNIYVPQNASYSQMRDSTVEFQQQVKELKSAVKAERTSSETLVGRARVLTGALGVSFGWAGIYFTLLTGLMNGRTLGKLLFGIRAVKINGTRFSYLNGFVRQGGYIAGFAMGMLGFLKLLWEPNRQAVEDRIAATVVVKV